MDKPIRSLDLKDFDERYLGKRLYELTLKSPFYVAQTGAAVTKTYKFPFAHRLVKVEVKHCDAADADNTDAFTWSWSRQTIGTLTLPLASYSASAASNFSEVFGESYEYPSMLYKFITNTTNLHHVYLKVTIQLLEPLPTAAELQEIDKTKHS